MRQPPQSTQRYCVIDTVVVVVVYKPTRCGRALSRAICSIKHFPQFPKLFAVVLAYSELNPCCVWERQGMCWYIWKSIDHNHTWLAFSLVCSHGIQATSKSVVLSITVLHHSSNQTVCLKARWYAWHPWLVCHLYRISNPLASNPLGHSGGQYIPINVKSLLNYCG